MLESIYRFSFLSLAVSVILLSSSCSPFGADPDKVKPGTFVCKVDGEKFKASLTTASVTELSSTTSLNTYGYKSVIALGSDFVTFGIDYPTSSGLDAITYTYNSGATDACMPDPEICAQLTFYQWEENKTFEAGFGVGSMEVTFGTIEIQSGGLITASFSGTLVEAGSGKEVPVTEGVFSVEIE
ncbi:MAG: hypothetical protein GYB31_01720 [Bacteroidetes bacterium]|nr:hypothetical protein [Bacteroidota bacterium]